MTVEVRPKKFSQAKCSAYFNGTLHVMGHLTTQNLYHVCKCFSLFGLQYCGIPFDFSLIVIVLDLNCCP